MKVLTGLDLFPSRYGKGTLEILKHYSSCEDDNQEFNGCNIYDYIYILHRCIKNNINVSKLKLKLYDICNQIITHQNPDGGFSYYKNKNEKKYYYGKIISTSSKSSDLHSTALFLISLSLIDDALSMDLGLKMLIA